MNKPITLYSVLLTLAWSSASGALIISSSDVALTGATVDDFSSYAIGNPGEAGAGVPDYITDGVFTMLSNGGDYLSVRDSFNGSYGITGRSVVDYLALGVEISFPSGASAFGIHIGAGDVGKTWTVEAFSPLGASLGSGSVLVDAAKNTNGFFLGWSDTNIGSVVLSPSAPDTAIFDNLSYVAVPEPATSALMIGLAAGALLFIRRGCRNKVS